MVLWDTLVEPELLCLEIGAQAVGRVAFEVGDVETVLWKAVDLGQEFPRVLNGFFLDTGEDSYRAVNRRTTHLEIVSKRPVAQHFKEGMVIRVLADILQVCDASNACPM